MVESGEAALEYLKEHRPHLIFMDHLMPGIDGFETTKAIKQNPETSEVPVVMCTSNEGEEYLEQAKSIGVVDILPKPPTETKLHKILHGLNSHGATLQTTPAPTPAISSDEIAVIARDAADAAVRASLESLVQSLLASRLAELRQEVQQQTEAQARAIVAEALEQGLEQVREQARSASRQEAKAVATPLVREAATGILEAAGEALRKSAREAIDNRIEAWEQQWASERETLLAQAEDRAGTTAKAAASALRSANEDAVRGGAAAAERIAAQAAERVGREILASAQQGLTQAKWYAGAAALAGILAAVAVYFLP